MLPLADVGLSPTDLEVRDLARAVVAREIKPRARDVDESECFPLEGLTALADAGLLEVLLPGDSGQPGSFVQYSLIVSEISRECAATAVTYMTQVHAMLPILAAGDDVQKRRWLGDLASAKLIGSLAITEPDAGSDIASMTTRARRNSDGYVLDGHKMFITNGNHADIACVFARTGPGRYEDISVFVVDLHSPGVSHGRPLKKMGIRGSDTAQLQFDDVFVPADQLLGGEGAGFGLAIGALGQARLSTAAQAVGIAFGAWHRSFRYAQERVQFGRPIYAHQAVQLRLMTLLSKACSSEAMLRQVAQLLDEGAKDTTVETAMAKSYCADVAMEVASGSVDILGGYGYMREYEVERFMRDAKITQIYDGTNDINRIGMAKQLLRRLKGDGHHD